jgi:hypothetical protein
MTSAIESGAHPAPHASRVTLHESFFGLWGGPIAWLVQSSAGYALASQPCFRNGVRAMSPPHALEWTWPAMIGLTTGAIVVSLLSLWISWRAFKWTRREAGGDSRHLMNVGAGRTRFLAVWGMLLGGSFAIAAAMTYVAFLTLPRCAG